MKIIDSWQFDICRAGYRVTIQVYFRCRSSSYDVVKMPSL